MSAVVKETPATLGALIPQWVEAKRQEIIAIQARRDIDKQIVALMPKKDEGTESKDVGFFKVSVSYGIDRKVDSKKLDDEYDQLSTAVQNAFRIKYEVAAKEYKALSGADLDAAVAFVESKPSSPSVKIEVIDQAKAK
jgi:hypothetical protein